MQPGIENLFKDRTRIKRAQFLSVFVLSFPSLFEKAINNKGNENKHQQRIQINKEYCVGFFNKLSSGQSFQIPYSSSKMSSWRDINYSFGKLLGSKHRDATSPLMTVLSLWYEDQRQILHKEDFTTRQISWIGFAASQMCILTQVSYHF